MAKRTTAVALGVAVLCSVISALPARAGTTQYNPRRAGHPLRIVAYAMHPVGVALDYLIFRPAWWVGSASPGRICSPSKRSRLMQRQPTRRVQAELLS